MTWRSSRILRPSWSCQAAGQWCTGPWIQEFGVDEQLQKYCLSLLYYFSGCGLAEKVFPDEDYEFHEDFRDCQGTRHWKNNDHADFRRLSASDTESVWKPLRHPDHWTLQDERTPWSLYSYNEEQSRLNPRPVQYLSERHRFEAESEELQYQSWQRDRRSFSMRVMGIYQRIREEIPYHQQSEHRWFQETVWRTSDWQIQGFNVTLLETAWGDDSYIKLSRCVFKLYYLVNKSYLYI